MKSAASVPVDGVTLIAEIRRYLATVDAFREQGREPQWRPEPEVAAVPRRPRLDPG